MFHSLIDSIARLFSSKENCKKIYLTPQECVGPNTQFYHSEYFKKLYIENESLPLLVLGPYCEGLQLFATTNYY